jgi:predicted NBD/HSP70 family sugar kinase
VAVLGIDIGGSGVKVALIDDHQSNTSRSERYTDPDRDEMIAAIRSAIAGLGESIETGTPVGLCLPGRHSPSGDRIERSVNLPCLNGWAFDELIRAVLGREAVRYRAMSDIRATAHDLCVKHGPDGRVAVIAIGTGVGLAVLENGLPLGIGSRGIGHLGMVDVGRLGDRDRIASDGAINTLESYVGARALRAQWGEGSDSDLVEQVEQAPQHEPFMQAIARGLRLVHAIHRPDKIVLAGGIGIALSPRAREIRAIVDDGLTTLANSDWSLLFGDSLYHAAFGAARLADE